MASEVELARLRKSYAAIRQGFSAVIVNGVQVYIKHLSSLERGDIDIEHVRFYDQAVSKGLPSQFQKLAELHLSGQWTNEDEKGVSESRLYIKNLNDTKNNLHLPSQIPAMNKQIEDAAKILRAKEDKRFELLGMTAEEFSQRKLNELYIHYSFYKDKFFQDYYISKEEMNQLEDSELAKLVSSYNEKISEVSELMIKKIALSRFFQDLYSLCDKDAYKFFGKPIADFTYYQCDLAIYGRFFNFILGGETKPPSDIIEDPDKVIEWHNISRNAARELAKKESSGSQNSSGASLVGASQNDYETLGIKQEGDSLNAVAEKKGGKLNKNEMLAYLKGRKV